MKKTKSLKSKAHQQRRKIVIEEINILRNLEVNHLMQDKITRELTKLHTLWFKSPVRVMNNIEL